MGSVGDFFLGGSKQKQSGENSSSQSSNSQNQAQNSNVQASQSTSNQSSGNASGSANQSYGELNSSLAPSLGYVSSAGSMLGALLGLPASTVAPVAGNTNVLPAIPHSSQPSGSGLSPMLNTILQQYIKSQNPASTPTPTPTPSPIPGGNPTPVPVTGGGGTSIPIGTGGGSLNRLPPNIGRLEARATGGPVNAGQPYVVGEKQPEVFVPHTSGTIVPRVPNTGMNLNDLLGRFGGHKQMSPGGGGTGAPIPGTPAPAVPPVGTVPPAPVTPGVPTAPAAPNPTDAVNTFANSAGMNFILDQGQKALSGASAANGVFDSGATGKALTSYGQNLGKTYLDDYMGHLLDYAKLGLGSASALSGAGGVSQAVGSSTGGSNSASLGFGSGSSFGTSTSTGTSTGQTSGSGSSKKGLVPDILG